jgi:hypothetical protein
MHRIGVPELVIFCSILVLLFFTIRRPPRKPPRFPRHPIPAQELLDVFVKIKNRCADSWRF